MEDEAESWINRKRVKVPLLSTWVNVLSYIPVLPKFDIDEQWSVWDVWYPRNEVGEVNM